MWTRSHTLGIYKDYASNRVPFWAYSVELVAISNQVMSALIGIQALPCGDGRAGNIEVKHVSDPSRLAFRQRRMYFIVPLFTTLI